MPGGKRTGAAAPSNYAREGGLWLLSTGRVSGLVAMTTRLAQPLGLPLVLLEEVFGRLATETDERQRIRKHLGWRPCDDDARTRLTTWLTQRATDDLLPSALVARAEDLLRSWPMVLPAWSTLEALGVSVTARLQDEVYTRMVTGCRRSCSGPWMTCWRSRLGDGARPYFSSRNTHPKPVMP